MGWDAQLSALHMAKQHGTVGSQMLQMAKDKRDDPPGGSVPTARLLWGDALTEQ